ncbi:MAG: hypothetical protein E7603_04730 [Ruminococcaceae bacterium]|nr:hypothetical protein [Oscillospiraceae bacterium]
MLIYVSVKQMSKRKSIQKCPFLLDKEPHTLRELIEETVRSTLYSYYERAQGNELPLNETQWEEMQEAGKFAFGFHYNTNVIAEEKAVAIALEAVADGVVRIFQDTKPLEDLNQPITVNEGDTFTFIKLTMLSGRMW